MLAQFGSNSTSNSATGLPIAQQPQQGVQQNLSRGLQGAAFGQHQRPRSRHKNAKPQVQNGPEQVLYAFQGGSDGGVVNGGPIFDSSGNLFGVTQFGGGGPCDNIHLPSGCGAVFELSPSGNGGWTEILLHSFQGSDGEGPSGELILDHAGNLYGTTLGGANYLGTVFELSPNGSGEWTETTLYTFQGGSDGAAPRGGLIVDQSGNLYGTASEGGEGTGECGVGCGTVFELSPNGSGGWTETTLYTFQGGSDGFAPAGGLIFDQSGNLYGMTIWGGGTGCYGAGCGIVFELSPNGSGGWTETDLYTLQGTLFAPYGGLGLGLILDQSGNLYATTSQGGGPGCGFDGCGFVFELSPNGSGGWRETTLYTFQGGSDGWAPVGRLTFDQSGNLYGTTIHGGGTGCGSVGCGTVFELSPNGSGGWTEALLYAFQGGSDGDDPPYALIFDQSGNLYSTTQSGGGSSGCDFEGFDNGCGVVFEVTKEPLVVFSPTSLSFGNQTVGIGSSPLVATLTNSGNLPLTITSIQITGADSTDFGQTNNCPSSLPPNNSCNISVTFTPTATGNRSAAVSVTDNAPGSPQSVPLAGVGVLPAATFSPTSLNFGNQTAGTTSSPLGTTLTNTGQGTLTITSIGIGGTNSNEFAQKNNCPSSLSPNNSCNISVTFSPTALGNANASLTVADNAPGSPQSVPLTGTGVSGITLSPPSVNFPNQYVGTSGLPQNVTLKNTGDTVLTITNVTASPTDFAPLSTCGNSVGAGASCSIGVFFDPTTSGTRNGVLTVTDSATNSPQTVPLSGMGQDFSVAPSSSSSATVMPGQVAKYAIVVKPAGGFDQTVTLTCSGAPAQSSCSISPSSVTLNGTTSTPVTATVTTAGTSASLARPFGLPRAADKLALWLAFSGLPGLVLLGRRTRKRHGRPFYGVALLCALFIAMTWSACGGGGSSGVGTATPAGTYNLTVVGTFTSGSANLVHSTKLTLVVQ